MAAATIKAADPNTVQELEIVRLTTSSTSDTYRTRKFADIVAAFATNESDNDGVSVAWSGQTVTVGVATATDVVTLVIAGRK